MELASDDLDKALRDFNGIGPHRGILSPVQGDTRSFPDAYWKLEFHPTEAANAFQDAGTNSLLFVNGDCGEGEYWEVHGDLRIELTFEAMQTLEVTVPSALFRHQRSGADALFGSAWIDAPQWLDQLAVESGLYPAGPIDISVGVHTTSPDTPGIHLGLRQRNSSRAWLRAKPENAHAPLPSGGPR